MAVRTINAPVVGMASTADGNGYWLVAADGGSLPSGCWLLRQLGLPDTEIPDRRMARTADGVGTGWWPPTEPSPGSATQPRTEAWSARSSTLRWWPWRPPPGARGTGRWPRTEGLCLRFSPVPRGAAQMKLNAPVTGVAVDAATGGYWLVGWTEGSSPLAPPSLAQPDPPLSRLANQVRRNWSERWYRPRPARASRDRPWTALRGPGRPPGGRRSY